MSLKKNWNDLTLTNLNKLFFASGTRVFGGATDESDHDFLVPPCDCKLAWDILKFFDNDRENYYDKRIYSYKFYLKVQKPTLVNLIIFKTAEMYDAWVFATDKMKNTFEYHQKDRILTTKFERHMLFQNFVAIYMARILEGE